MQTQRSSISIGFSTNLIDNTINARQVQYVCFNGSLMASALKLSLPDQAGLCGIEQILNSSVTSRPLNVVCVGAHPDDPETGCGGTLAKLAGQGHRVSIVYLTRGEAGIKNGDGKTTSELRTAEALRASALLGARAFFANQVDGQTSTEEGAARQ